MIRILLVGIASVLVFAVVQRLRSQSRRVACSNNLKQISLAYQMYVNDRRIGGGPPAPDPFQDLVEGEYIDDPEMFVCPTSGDRYRLRPMIPSDGDPSTDPVAICRCGHRGGANVLYLQGNVKWVTERELERHELLSAWE